MTPKNDKQDGIDVAELLRSIWNRRRFILTVTGIFLLAGLLFALFGRVMYTATTVMVPQTGGGSSGGQIQGLAAMAGINLGSSDDVETLLPVIYPMVVTGTAFQKELMHSMIPVGESGERVKLLDYLVPRREKDENEAVGAADGVVELLTRRENICVKILARRLLVDVDRTDGYVTIEATMPDAVIAARVAARAQELLEEYITRFRIEKVQADLEFIEERYSEAKVDFEEKQSVLARFQDNNLDLSSATGRARESRLSDEYKLAFSIYSNLAAQREQARIKVKEDTPVFTVVQPVTVPAEKSAPKRTLIMAGTLLLGLVIGIMLVFMLPGLARVFDSKWLKRWHPTS